MSRELRSAYSIMFRAGDAAPGVYGVESVCVGGEEDDAGEDFGGQGEKGDLGFEGYTECAFGAAEEIDPIHLWLETVAGGVLGRSGNGKLVDFEVDRLASAVFAD